MQQAAGGVCVEWVNDECSLLVLGGAALTINNCTMTHNGAVKVGGALWVRGDLQLSPATTVITNCTINGNYAAFAGGSDGGVSMLSAKLEVGNTILLAAPYVWVSALVNNGGSVTSYGHNLCGDSAGGDGTTGPGGLLGATGDIRNTDPLLGPLGNNGGPTFTQALWAGSPAINAGDPDFTSPPVFDQRGAGFPRVKGGRIDIGAFEVQESDGTWTDMGHPLNGWAGLPLLTAFGTLSGGQPDSIDLTQARWSSPATLIVGLSQLNAPFKGGVMVPNPLLLLFLGTNAIGEVHLPFVMPTVPAGLSLYFQFWIQDSVGIAGYSASNGLKGVTH